MLNTVVPANQEQHDLQENDFSCTGTLGDDLDDAWGDPILPKATSTLRFAFQNIQGLPISPYSDKHSQIISVFNTLQLDSFGLAELNLNFSRLPSSLQWKERFKGLYHKHTTYSTNTHATTTDCTIFGGTAQLTQGTLAHRAISSGQDNTGLGRWVWTRFIGKNGTHLRSISGYRPVSGAHSDGPFQVANQHETYFLAHDDDRPARVAFLEDLDVEIHKWLDMGDSIILSLDANEFVRSNDLLRYIRRWRLIDAHHYRFPHASTVATCSKNRRNIPIDGIWISSSIDVTACGYSGFGEYTIGSSDHRLLWIDVSAVSCLGLQPPKPTYIAPRRLSLNDPRIVARYNKTLRREYERLKLPQRATQLHNQLPEFGTPAQQEYETLARQDLQCRRHAEKFCRKLRMGAVPYSDTLHQADNKVQMWLLLRKKRQGLRASTKKIRRLMRQTKVMTAFTFSITEIEAALLQARQEYKQVKKLAANHRSNFRRRLTTNQARYRGVSADSQKRMTSHTEQQRILARRVRSVTGRHPERCSFKILDEPRPNTTRRLCTTRPEIEQACMTEGYRRFTQSANTPFLQPPLLAQLGHLAESPTAEAILTGSYIPPNSMDEMTKKFITQLQRDPSIPDLHTGYFTSAQHSAGWKKVRANTSSCPSGPGFVDYIAGSRDPIISDFDATMASIPFYVGYSPHSWSTATDVLIPKKAESISVEQLRIIVLYHALFNQSNKAIGRSLIYHAETFSQIPWEIYGSRRHHRCIECATNNVLTNDIWRQSRRPGALCSNDAKSCYDRIVHNVAILAMRRLGLSPETCHVMIGTLDQVRHHVRTAYGDSASTYQGIEIPLQGIGQGNGAGPAIWLIVSVVIINMLKAEGFGFKTRTPISNDPFEFVCYTFVDDTDLVHSPSSEATLESLCIEMQSVLDHWEGGLHASGGALVPSKSYWYLISFKWHNDRWTYRTIADTPGSLAIFDTNRTRVTLDRLEASEARETLGVCLAMDGNQQAEYEKLRQIACRWAEQVRCGQLSTAEAWFSLNQTIMKTLEYPLMATCLTSSQCNTIMQTLLKAALPKLHIAMSFPKVARFGPRRLQGLGIPHIWTTQGIEKLWAIFRHGDDHTITGFQIRSSIEYYLLELGLPGQLFSYPYSTLKHLATPSWITSLWEFVSTKGFLLSDAIPTIPLKCLEDKFLTEAFLLNQPNKTDLRLANLCRQWLRVLRISDISSGDGKHIIDQFWHGTAQCSLNSAYDWPRTEKPSAAAWRAWRFLLSHISHGPSHIFNQPLGMWTEQAASGNEAEWKYSDSDNRLYHRTLGTTHVYTSVSGRATRRPRFTYACSTNDPLPADAARTTVYFTGTLVQHTGTRTTTPLATVTTPLSEEYSHWSHECLSIPVCTDIILNALSSGSAFALCDGSFKSGHGTAAFAIQDSYRPDGRIIGCHRTPGHTNDQNSFRSEVGGILAIVLLVNRLCHTHDIQSGSIEVACDCQSALTVVFEHEWDEPTQSSYDLIHATRRAVLQSPVKWKCRYVRGHQDQHTTFDRLDWRSQLNVEIDGLAKAYWNDTYNNHIPFYDETPTLWHLGFRGRQFSCLDKKLIYDICHGPPLQEYWKKKHRMSAEAITSINWEVCDDGLRRLGLFRRIWLAKMNTGTAPTGKILLQRGHQLTANCPRCGHFEDNEHIFRCPQPAAVTNWNRSVEKLNTWLHQHFTHPEIHAALIQHLTQWHTSDNPVSDLPYSLPVLQCCQDQNAIGWNGFLLGFTSKYWEEVQHAYYVELESRRTGFRWACSLFSQVINMSWKMWDHRCEVQKQPNSLSQLDEHRRINALIQEEYDRGTLGWRHRDRRWFSRPPHDLFNEPIPYKTEWLQSVTITRERHGRRQYTPHEQEQRTMRQFFSVST